MVISYETTIHLKELIIYITSLSETLIQYILKLIVDSPYNYWNPPLTTKLGPKISSTIFLVCQIGP